MFHRITLECSLKPFFRTDRNFIRETCRGLFTQWRPLLKGRGEIAILLWVGDGSEILDYDGNMTRPIEWARYMGTANLPFATAEDDPALTLHSKKRLYRQDVPEMTLEVLREIIRAFREEGTAAFPQAHIRVGETFDIGPEFAVSDFKYKRHPEVCSGTSLDSLRFVDCTALLHADRRPYAAFPDGIPEGTPFANFFGRQTAAFFADMGFDYIWLSNGLGFGADPWELTGKIYDGQQFHADRLGHTAEKVFRFWELFRGACPEVPVEVRGTNNSAGIDFATDGVPLYDIYRANPDLLPPPNSPWAALNDNYGLEMMGHMSRICELPGETFLFRYYIHDCWWKNSPWYDRYDGYASDIYLPMAVSRVRGDGSVQSAGNLSLFTLDNTAGESPDACVYEPLPHLMKAEKDAADAMAFLVWLYPLREYTSADCVERGVGELTEMYHGDLFVADAINHGLPLNYVLSTDCFLQCPQQHLQGRILLTPVPDRAQVLAALEAFVSAGGRVILYGSENRLTACPLSGETVVRVRTDGDSCALRQALERFGYCIRFDTQEGYLKLPALTAVRADNGLFVSVYNPDTTTDTLLRFPLGAPVLLGGETQLCGGFARYRFGRCEHRECRIFVQQEEGIVSAHEEAPVSAKYRRRFYIKGLRNATVYYFPEQYCAGEVAVSTNDPDSTPILDTDWIPIRDEVFGPGFVGRNKSGQLSFLMPFPEYLKGKA